jgi:CBS domain-containing protein
MQHARDVMVPARTVEPELDIPGLARLLLDEDLDGVCVVQGDALVGVVTAMDLVFRSKKVHPPVTFALLELVLELGRRRTEKELAKITAATVGGLMTGEVVTVAPDTPLDEIASHMVEQHLTLLPVLDSHGALVGVVTKDAMVQETLRQVAGMAAD